MIDITKIKTEVNMQLMRNEEVIEERLVSNIITNAGFNMIADRTAGTNTAIVNKIAIGKVDTPANKADTGLANQIAELGANLSVSANTITYTVTFTQATTYEVKETGLLSAGNVLYARTTFPVINKGINDSLKITWKWTIQ